MKIIPHLWAVCVCVLPVAFSPHKLRSVGWEFWSKMGERRGDVGGGMQQCCRAFVVFLLSLMLLLCAMALAKRQLALPVAACKHIRSLGDGDARRVGYERTEKERNK